MKVWDKLDIMAGRLARRLNDARYWFLYRLHPAHRYHVVRTGLAPDYYDEDIRMLHACMACLVGYIEECGGPEELDRSIAELRASTENEEKFPGQHASTNDQANRQAEALAIHRWWTIERPADERRHDELEGHWHNSVREAERRQTLWALEDKIASDEQEMLRRLIEIRPSLWT